MLIVKDGIDSAHVGAGPLTVLSPAPVRAIDITRPADRITTIAGKTIGFLDNNKPGARHILERLAVLLQARGASSVRYWQKALPSGPSPYLDEAARGADVVVSGVGDCGSCSSWSLRDALEVEFRGVPTVTLVSDPFVDVVQIEAESLGMPGLKVLALPHPIATLSDAELDDIADGLLGPVLTSLVQE